MKGGISEATTAKLDEACPEGNEAETGRWNGVSMFVTERVIRGDVQVHQTFVFETGPCAHPQRGELYLLSLNCRDGKCGVAWAEEDEAPALLRYLDLRRELERPGKPSTGGCNGDDGSQIAAAAFRVSD